MAGRTLISLTNPSSDIKKLESQALARLTIPANSVGDLRSGTRDTGAWRVNHNTSTTKRRSINLMQKTNVTDICVLDLHSNHLICEPILKQRLQIDALIGVGSVCANPKISLWEHYLQTLRYFASLPFFWFIGWRQSWQKTRCLTLHSHPIQCSITGRALKLLDLYA